MFPPYPSHLPCLPQIFIYHCYHYGQFTCALPAILWWRMPYASCPLYLPFLPQPEEGQEGPRRYRLCAWPLPDDCLLCPFCLGMTWYLPSPDSHPSLPSFGMATPRSCLPRLVLYCYTLPTVFFLALPSPSCHLPQDPTLLVWCGGIVLCLCVAYSGD